jgi:hypothetical protein
VDIHTELTQDGEWPYTDAVGGPRQVSENWRCPVCKGGVQLNLDLYLAVQAGEVALQEEVKKPMTCSQGHPLVLSEQQQEDLMIRLRAEWAAKGRAQA